MQYVSCVEAPPRSAGAVPAGAPSFIAVARATSRARSQASEAITLSPSIVVHLDADADVAQQRDGELAAEVFLEIGEAGEQRRLFVGVEPAERVVPEREAERSSKPQMRSSARGASKPTSVL